MFADGMRMQFMLRTVSDRGGETTQVNLCCQSIVRVCPEIGTSVQFPIAAARHVA